MLLHISTPLQFRRKYCTVLRVVVLSEDINSSTRSSILYEVLLHAVLVNISVVALCPTVLSVLSAVPLLLQLLQAAVVAVSAHRRQPSPGEDGACLGASSCSSRSSRARGGRAGGGRGGQRRPRPGLKTCRVQTHLYTDKQIQTSHYTMCMYTMCLCGCILCVCILCVFVCFAHPSVSL